MVHHAVHSWTLVGLVRAFLSLTFAYFLLWGSAFAFCVSKFLNFLGLFLPCPCSGFLGYKNSNFCLYRLLFYLPIKKIYAVLNLVSCRFPFNLIWFRDGECSLNGNGGREEGVLELEGGRCSNSFSGFRLQNFVDKESGFDTKGKKVMNQKQKSGARRRRRAGFGYGRPPSALPYNSDEMRSKTSGNYGLGNEIEDAFHDDKDAQTSTGVSERAWHGFQLSGSFGEDGKVEKVSSSLKRFTSNSQEKVETPANEVDRIRILEKAFQEVKAAHDVAFLELEQERAAAATAADEAMAMIVRLQEDKASIEMEARQYQRMIEEKFAYDEEEMSILQEILVRKEKENHLLEKEVEAYRQMNVLRGEDSRPMLQQISSGCSFDKKELGKDASGFPHDAPSDCEQSYTSPVGKRIASMEWGVDSDLYPSSESAQISEASSDRSSFSYSDHGTPVKHVVVEGKVYAQNENNLSCQRKPTKAVQGIEKSPLSGDDQVKDEELRDHSCSKLQSRTLEMEPTIYDVHVVDDRTEFHKEKNVREGGPCTSIASDNKSFLTDLGSKSSSRVKNEKLRTDIEMELLSERLRKVKEQKERLIFSADQKEMVSAHLKLMEDIMNQLRELQLLREPVRQGSLPTSSSSKANSNKRRYRSVSYEPYRSA